MPEPRLDEMSDEELHGRIVMHGPDWWWRLRAGLAQVLIGRRRFKANQEIYARLRGAPSYAHLHPEPAQPEEG